MGGDFQYESSTEQFTNLDKLIHYCNELEGAQVNFFYSTPTAYADAKNAEGISWQVKTDDFFPYADSAHAYWFTSHPTSTSSTTFTFTPFPSHRFLSLVANWKFFDPSPLLLLVLLFFSPLSSLSSSFSSTSLLLSPSSPLTQQNVN